jgi:hypothetical protein
MYEEHVCASTRQERGNQLFRSMTRAIPLATATCSGTARPQSPMVTKQKDAAMACVDARKKRQVDVDAIDLMAATDFALYFFAGLGLLSFVRFMKEMVAICVPDGVKKVPPPSIEVRPKKLQVELEVHSEIKSKLLDGGDG